MTVILSSTSIDVDDRQAQGDADLGCGQAHAGGDLHRFDHVVDQLLNRPIDLGNLLRFLTQHGIADDEDGPNHNSRRAAVMSSVGESTE